MSDQEESTSAVAYDTPIPELDDHRQQSQATQRLDRPRRGTFDSLYGSRHHDQAICGGDHVGSGVRVRDFEEAIIDDDVEASLSARRSRRPTVDTVNDQRDVSPPNSVKAFAQARRREREMSSSGSKGDKNGDEDGVNRALSIASRRSLRSRPHTVDDDVASLETNQSAADDVCFPHDEHRKDQMYIDFNYLENFINEEKATRMNSRTLSGIRVFPDLRPQTSETSQGPVQMATADGDIVEVPSDMSSSTEKHKHEEAKHFPRAQVLQSDPNRFSFFSSAWESTIHAAELGDLVMPGEDLRGLFALPPNETDGVWWLNINNPTKEEVIAICKAFGIHPLTTEDITTREAREKIELFPAYYFACFRSFLTVDESDGPEYEPHNIYVVVFREGTLSFSFAPNSHASHVRKRIALLKDYLSLSSDWICYAMM
jgi:magnesium transporter